MKPDQTIGRYKILERVGRGGMGVLYRGNDPVLDREVAIKVMSADFEAGDDGPDQDSRTRFFREARAAAKLQHRNIVTIFEFAEEQGVPYIVMEFLRGRSLAARMRTEPPLSLEEKIDIVAELCIGLHFAHEHGIVHRDVKPGNVWLQPDGTVKLLDFGIAKIAASTFTRQGEILGSVSYMAPEQLSGAAVDARTDVFAASVVLYELLAGRKPFESDSPTATLLQILHEEPPPLASLVPDVPPLLVSVVSKGLRKNPATRYQTAADLAADLDLVRMAVQSTGDTVSLELEEVYGAAAEVVAERTLVEPSVSTPESAGGTPHGTRRSESVEPKSSAWGWVGALAAAAVILTGAGWYGSAYLSRPAPATVLIQTDPPGAAIELDGRDMRLLTPATVELPDPTPTRIRLTRQGFEPIDTAVTAAELASGSVRYRLTPQNTTP